jgi:hypothetical protein
MWNVDNDSMNAKRIYFLEQQMAMTIVCSFRCICPLSTLHKSRSVISYPVSPLQANKESVLSSGAADLLMSEAI